MPKAWDNVAFQRLDFRFSRAHRQGDRDALSLSQSDSKLGFNEGKYRMGSTIRIGVLSQLELPKQLEPLVKAIFQEQFRKLISIFGSKNLTLVGSVEGRCDELACISAIGEGLILELAPFKEPLGIDEKEAEIQSKVHATLKKQPETTELVKYISDAELIGFCDIMIFAFDKSNLAQRQKFGKMRDELFMSELADTSLDKLLIEINCPQLWSPDADGEVHFEYITRAKGRPGISSEIEIPGKLIQQWVNAISATPH